MQKFDYSIKTIFILVVVNIYEWAHERITDEEWLSCIVAFICVQGLYQLAYTHIKACTHTHKEIEFISSFSALTSNILHLHKKTNTHKYTH